MMPKNDQEALSILFNLTFSPIKIALQVLIACYENASDKNKLPYYMVESFLFSTGVGNEKKSLLNCIDTIPEADSLEIKLEFVRASICSKNIKKLESFVNFGFPINSPHRNGKFPIVFACEKAFYQGVQLLLRNNAIVTYEIALDMVAASIGTKNISLIEDVLSISFEDMTIAQHIQNHCDYARIKKEIFKKSMMRVSGCLEGIIRLFIFIREKFCSGGSESR